VAVTSEADYVIVGGGTAGCVLANRLSADPATTVLVLEAGGEASSPWISMPAGIAKLFHHPRLNWRYTTEPEAALGGRALYWPRGKVLGGTSSINGMTFTRGQREDYEAWAVSTGGAWSWRDVLPYFRRIEDSAFGSADLRGRGGPLAVAAIPAPHPLSHAFLAAAVNCGIPHNDDYNGAQQEGIGFTQVMMKDGRRESAYSAYLAPVRSRPNVRVTTGATAQRIVFEAGRAVGVAVARGGASETVRARREVIVCAGTIASPQLLMLSGVGDAKALRTLGIDVVADVPAVGRNLQEHVRVQVACRTRVPSYNAEARGVRLAGHALRYAFGRRGLLAVTASQVNGFVRSSPGVDRPDLQLVFRPSSGDYRDGRFVIHDFPGAMAMAGYLRPQSRGHVSLRSPDPHARPAIVTGHLTDERDIEPLVRGLRMLREVLATAPLRELIEAEIRPGADVIDDAALRDYVRRTADSLYHAVGTCAMGADASSATTPELRVRGVEALRVVDASVMPLVPSGNTTAAVLMIAERAADLVRGIVPARAQ
jgi:choline dehydrogenase